MVKIIDRSATRQGIDKFVRHQNVERYKRLMSGAKDEDRRKYLVKLIAAEEQKQQDAGDTEYLY